MGGLLTGPPIDHAEIRRGVFADHLPRVAVGSASRDADDIQIDFPGEIRFDSRNSADGPVNHGKFQEFPQNGVWTLLDGGGGVFYPDSGAFHGFHRLVVELAGAFFAVFMGEVHRIEPVAFRKRFRNGMQTFPQFLRDSVA